MTRDLKTHRAEAVARGGVSGVAEHRVTALGGVKASVEPEKPRASLRTGAAVVEHMGFAPLPVDRPARGSHGPSALEAGATSATAGFEARFRLQVPIELDVTAAARVTVESTVKTTENAGRVSLQTRDGPRATHNNRMEWND